MITSMQDKTFDNDIAKTISKLVAISIRKFESRDACMTKPATPYDTGRFYQAQQRFASQVASSLQVFLRLLL